MPDRKSLKETLSKQEILSSPEAIAFVEGKKVPGNESTVEKKPNSMKTIKSRLAPADATKNTRITADLPGKLHKRLKAATVDIGTDINTLVNTLISDFLDENDY